MVSKAAQILGFGQDGESVDRANAGDCPEPVVVGVLGRHQLGAALDLVTLADQAASLRQGHAE